MSPEERTKAFMEKIADFDLDDETRTEVENVIADFVKEVRNAAAELRKSGADQEAIETKRKEFEACNRRPIDRSANCSAKPSRPVPV